MSSAAMDKVDAAAQEVANTSQPSFEWHLSGSQSMPLKRLLPLIKTRRDAQALLQWIRDYDNEHRLRDIRNTSGYIISKLLECGHYAGAREVIEAIFLSPNPRHNSAYEGVVSLSSSQVNQLLRSILSQPFSADISSQFMTSLLEFILHHLLASPGSYVSTPTTVILLLSHPHFLDLTCVEAVVKLLHKVEHQLLERRGHLMPVRSHLAHGIMQAYAKAGNVEESYFWMSQALAAAELSPEKSNFVIYEAASKSFKSSKSSKSTEPFTFKQDFPLRSLLGTTHISSFRYFSQSEPQKNRKNTVPTLAENEHDSPERHLDDGYPRDVSEMASIDAKTAMTFFDQLRRAPAPTQNFVAEPSTHGAAVSFGSSQALRSNLAPLDVVAWTAILAVAARDIDNVGAYDLSRVVDTLRLDINLPDPNIVTYTVLMSGMLRRGLPDLALAIFRSLVIPLVHQGKLELDAAALQEVICAITELGNRDAGLRVVEFFGKILKTPADRDMQIPDAPVDVDTSQDAGEASAMMMNTLDIQDLPDSLRNSVTLDIKLMNSVLNALKRTLRFRTFWNVYDQLEDVYNVRPNETTLTIATGAILAESSVKRRLATGKSGQAKRHYAPDVEIEESAAVPSSLHDANEHGFSWLIARLSHPFRQRHDVWREMWWQMLANNYPEANRRARRAVMSRPEKLWRDMVLPTGVRQSGYDNFQLTNALDVSTRRAGKASDASRADFAHLTPGAPGFRVFLSMLSYYGNCEEIPLAFSWMKELHIIPSRRTLCDFMLAYEESGPLKSEFSAFNRFLLDWLGEESVPTDADLARHRVQGMRSRQT